MLSLEDVRSILHISKRKAAWMLQNGFIKCEIRHNKTKKYKVQIENLFIYLDKVERGDSSVQIPIGIFNAKKPSGKEKKERFRSNPMRLKKPTKAFREWLTDKFGRARAKYSLQAIFRALQATHSRLCNDGRSKERFEALKRRKSSWWRRNG